MSMVRKIKKNMFGNVEDVVVDDTRLSIYLGQFPDHPDLGIVREYIHKLKSGGFSNDTYWTKDDGHLYRLFEKYYDNSNSKKFEKAATEVYCLSGCLWRCLMDKSYGKKEEALRKTIMSSYNSGGVYLKLAAWVAVHSYLSNSFINISGICNIIPEGRPDVAAAWNKYIFSMESVDNATRALFILDSNCESEFVRRYSKVDPADREHPTDDAPQSSDVDNKMDNGKSIKFENSAKDKKKSIFKKAQENVKKATEEDTSGKKETIDGDPKIRVQHSNEAAGSSNMNVDKKLEDNEAKNSAVDVKTGEIVSTEEIFPEQKFTQEEAESNNVKEGLQESSTDTQKKTSDKSDMFENLKNEKRYQFGTLVQAFRSNDGTEDAAGKAPDVPKEKPANNVSSKIDTEEADDNTPDNVVDQYTEYNKQWEDAYPGLDKFTKIIHSAGYSVVYAAANNFPGLILVQIVDMNMNNRLGGVKKYLFIDPGFIYGDTMRIISTDRKDGNLYKEVFLPRSKKNDIVKLVTEGLTKEDRKRINTYLPRSIYDVINKVDMKDCNISNYLSWRYLVINISNVLRNLPECRMRLIDVQANNMFKLICDDEVVNIYNNGIMDTDSHKDACENGLFVDYDPNKYGDKLYMVGYKSGKELDFDPYKIMPDTASKKEKKAETESNENAAK